MLVLLLGDESCQRSCFVMHSCIWSLRALYAKLETKHTHTGDLSHTTQIHLAQQGYRNFGGENSLDFENQCANCNLCSLQALV